MNKEEFRKHCEDQIERCIKLYDSKHLKEHELSLALLNECEQRRQNQENLIKYIEDKIKEYKNICIGMFYSSKTRIQYDAKIENYEDLLERIKNNNYEESNIE